MFRLVNIAGEPIWSMLAEKYQYDGGGSSGGAEAFHIPTILSACHLCKEIILRENDNCVSRLNEFDKD